MNTILCGCQRSRRAHDHRRSAARDLVAEGLLTMFVRHSPPFVRWHGICSLPAEHRPAHLNAEDGLTMLVEAPPM